MCFLDKLAHLGIINAQEHPPTPSELWDRDLYSSEVTSKLEPPPAWAVENGPAPTTTHLHHSETDFLAMPAGLVGPRHSGLLDPPTKN